jgi:hypothetical protein
VNQPNEDEKIYSICYEKALTFYYKMIELFLVNEKKRLLDNNYQAYLIVRYKEKNLLFSASPQTDLSLKKITDKILGFFVQKIN